MSKARDDKAKAMLPPDEPRCKTCNVLASLGHMANCPKGPILCDSCEEAPPTIVVNVTTLDGTLLDQKKVCRPCASDPDHGYGFDIGTA